MASKRRPPKSNHPVEAALRDAEGIVELTNMQLRLALELRRKLEAMAQAKEAKKSRKKR